MSEKVEFNIIKFDKLASTNNQLKTLNQERKLEEYSVVITHEQTAGKGQAGNSWESEPGKNLTFSLLLKPDYIEIQEQFIISKAVALGVVNAFSKFSPHFTVKWPNDIYYRDKKIGGILIENSLTRNIISESITGIGLNINQKEFVSDAPNPISLCQITNKSFVLEEILRDVLESIVENILKIRRGETNELDSLYLTNLYRNEGFHAYKDKDGDFLAEITGINPYGHLELRTAQGDSRSYAFKEVEFIR